MVENEQKYYCDYADKRFRNGVGKPNTRHSEEPRENQNYGKKNRQSAQQGNYLGGERLLCGREEYGNRRRKSHADGSAEIQAHAPNGISGEFDVALAIENGDYLFRRNVKRDGKQGCDQKHRDNAVAQIFAQHGFVSASVCRT